MNSTKPEVECSTSHSNIRPQHETAVSLSFNKYILPTNSCIHVLYTLKKNHAHIKNESNS